MKEKVTLQLTLTVTYRPNGTPTDTLIEYLKRLSTHAAGDGLFTGDSEAEVEIHDYSVKEIR